ncbi:MAG: HAMP domain-containing protein [Kofleriaceae bacterium]|jgi:two-component system nitrogen regulation sensor histidine kinase NtrY|nr:HAMP domain-containing protein [Kofleriaceae bacterium]MBP9172825.1 HAMP domain-containing protein [Kofleriaceae bacterium]MBP9863422.1 HAMP domain-containing protein [Kofleriaceae bacterium]
MTAPGFGRGLSLQVKLVALLLVVVLIPPAASAYLITRVSRVAADFAAVEAASRNQSLERALRTYRELIETKKQHLAEVARRLAQDPRIAGLDGEALETVLASEPEVSRLALFDRVGRELAKAERPPPEGSEIKSVKFPLLAGGSLEVGVPVPAGLQQELRELSDSLTAARMVAGNRSALSAGYVLAFLAIVGGSALAAILVGVVAARRVTGRIGALVEVARVVARGSPDARARLGGTDEVSELGAAFDAMLDDLSRQRTEIDYLQRIGAWQDVARRLAHEIKNPLTPIQLAVQQCVSSYAGDDPRFKRLLTDTGEIVEEEIAALRRLVDTFRTLGQLPRVEAAPVPLYEIVDELRLDPALAQRLTLVAPTAAVQVRADKLLLKRVLTNLVENGIHAGQEAGRPGAVTVTWTAKGEHAEVTVDDEGKGVAAEARARIFEPYVTTKATGTGLGLAIAKKIALEHGGTLDVAAAAAPTGGARFVLTVPLAP